MLQAAEAVRSKLEQLLTSHGWGKDGAPRDTDQAIGFELLGQLAGFLGDPDASVAGDCRSGVRIGFQTPLPRCPAIWPAKLSWRLGLEDLGDPCYLNSNYTSSAHDRATLEAEFDDQVKEGMMLRTTFGEASRRWPQLRVAALAIIPEPGGKERIIHDGTHFVGVNQEIRVRDLEQYPTPADVAAGIAQDEAEPSATPHRYLALKTDGSKAHRRVPVSELDWGLQACAVEPRPPGVEGPAWDAWPIYLNKVGTYGISSASWWWGRVGALLLRLIHYTSGLHMAFRFADDFMFVARPIQDATLRPFLRLLLLLQVLEVPLKWQKTGGGEQLEWIGFFFCFRSLTAGLSPKRAAWIDTWAKGALREEVVSVRQLKGFLGRLGFAAELLRHLKPFLAPLYAWTATCSDSGVRALPPAIRLTLSWLAAKVVGHPAVALRPKLETRGELFRADAKAEGRLIVVGGWELVPGNNGVSASRWFSITLDEQSAPWAFSRGLPYRTIAALELYATLLSVMLFTKPALEGSDVALSLSGSTDNLGNVYALRKHMTTKFPLCLMVMELSAQLEARNIDLRLLWRPREDNQAADDLTNLNFARFNSALRIEASPASLRWLVLPWLLEEAAALYDVIAIAKVANAAARLRSSTSASGPTATSSSAFRRPPGKRPRLRTTDPW